MSSPIKKRKEKIFVPNEKKDEKYYRKRKLNTQYARISRERKKKIELERIEELKKLKETVKNQEKKIKSLVKKNNILEEDYEKIKFSYDLLKNEIFETF